MRSVQIRVVPEFQKLIMNIRAKEMLLNAKEISCVEVSKILIKYLDWEKIWQDEFGKK